MIDLNVIDAPAVRYDLDAIVQRLRATAHAWVPGLFPNGRREGNEWRLANIHGDPPRNNGSCVIALTGEHAVRLAAMIFMPIARAMSAVA